MFSKSLNTLTRKHIDEIYDCNLNRKFYFYEDIDDEQLTRIRSNMRRSVKEYSFFDWSQALLHENDFLNAQNNNVNIFSKPNNTFNSDNNFNNITSTSSSIKLPAITITTTPLINKRVNEDENYKKFKGLPQVLTIRFS